MKNAVTFHGDSKPGAKDKRKDSIILTSELVNEINNLTAKLYELYEIKEKTEHEIQLTEKALQSARNMLNCLHCHNATTKMCLI